MNPEKLRGISAAYDAVLDCVDFDIINAAAAICAAELVDHGADHVTLEPDDGTHYEFVIVHNSALNAPTWVVASNMAPAYPWNGSPTIHPSYATEKWGGPSRNEWTGMVTCLFLNAVARAL